MTTPNLSTQAMLVGITMGLPRQSRELKVESGKIEQDNHAATGTVKSYSYYFKRKDAGKEVDGLSTLKRFQTAMKAALEHYARFPFAAGTKLLPAPLVEPFITTKAEYEQKIVALWTAWADDEYPIWMESAPARMGALYDKADFPTLTDCMNRFQCEVTMAPLGSADQVQRIGLLSPDMAKVITDATNEAFAKGVAESEAKNWKDLVGPLKHLVSTLEKPKHKIHDSLIGNIISIVEMIPAVNLSGDVNLAELAAKAKDGLCKITPDDMRKSSEAQAKALRTAKALVEEYEPYFRSFNLE